MLPSKFKIEWVDPVIRQLVININRVPEHYTMTTCQGHIWENTPLWPTKDGWIHFGHFGDDESLAEVIGAYSRTNEVFGLSKLSKLSESMNSTLCTVHAIHEDHDGGSLLGRITEEEQ